MDRKYRTLIADGLGSEGLNQLETLAEIELWNRTGIPREELKQLLPEVDILIVRSRTKVDADLMALGKSLKLVLRAGIGLDNVDVPAATDRAIIVMNAPSGNVVTTAEHTLALMFSVSRRIAEADSSLRQGKWEKKKLQGNELCRKTLGVVGLGNIGRTVAKRAIALGMKVIANDPCVSEESAAKQSIRLASMDELLTQADYVTLHLPLTAGTKHIIGENEFKKMKSSAYLINCARGGIVDESALIKALKEGTIFGAAMDVFESEPLSSDNPLLGAPHTVLTPHLGASTDEAQTQVSLEVAEQITQYVRNGVFQNAINVPNISLEKLIVLKPYLTLSEKLGSFLGQLSPQNVRKIKVHYSGTISEHQDEILTLSILKGFLTPLLEANVNFVNARRLLKERGIVVEEAFQDECEDYASLIQLEVEGDTTVTCSGTIFGKKEPRLVRVDRFNIDAIPSGVLLFTRNSDQPGVIGTVGAVLANGGINISRMHLGLNKQKGEAIALINVDSQLSLSLLDELQSAPGMLSVKQIQL